MLEPHVESTKSGCFALHYAPGARDVDSSRSDAESEELTFATARVPKTLPPRSSLALLLLFRPGALGFANQKATITFRSSEVPLFFSPIRLTYKYKLTLIQVILVVLVYGYYEYLWKNTSAHCCTRT